MGEECGIALNSKSNGIILSLFVMACHHGEQKLTVSVKDNENVYCRNAYNRIFFYWLKESWCREASGGGLWRLAKLFGLFAFWRFAE